MQSVLSVISGLLVLVCYVPYIQGMVCGHTKPVKSSWLIWALLDTITLAGMWTKGTLNAQIICVVLGVWIVTVLAFWWGIPGWSKLDLFCLVGAVLGLVLWWASGDAIVGIMMSATIMILGSFPTFVSAWKDPHRENRAAWTIMFISCVLALCAIPHWTLAYAAQPVSFMIVETIMMYLLWIRPYGRLAAPTSS